MITESAEIKRIVLIRLKSGEDILEGLNQAVTKEGLKNGVILNGFGSAYAYRYHVVADDNLPPLEAFPAGNTPKDIIAYSGVVIDGRIHCHITFSDSFKAEGGHLEPGSKALTFTVIAIADIGDTSVTDWDTLTEFGD